MDQDCPPAAVQASQVTPFLLLTEHAVQQAASRCGLEPRALRAQVETALQARRYHAAQPTERWIAVQGPNGPGTAIIVRATGGWDVVTVCDASTCTQGERQGRLTATLAERCRALTV